jgi:hypothetical protein
MTQQLRHHIFISFSHADKDALEYLVADLNEPSTTIWVDGDQIKPGTSDWENAVRLGVSQSAAMILLASPSSRSSIYVRGELALARAQNVPVIPVWVKGETWADCVPLEMIQYHYVDVRGDKRSDGLQELRSEITSLLKQKLGKVILLDQYLLFREDETADLFNIPTVSGYKVIYSKRVGNRCISCHRAVPPKGYLGIGLSLDYELINGNMPPAKGVLIRADDYKYLGQILDDLYINFLRQQYTPFSYGTSWLLCAAVAGTRQVLVPWQFLCDVPPGLDVWQRWQQSPLSRSGILNSVYWQIENISMLDHAVLVYRDVRAFNIFRSTPKAPIIMERYKILDRTSLEEIDVRRCDYAVFRDVWLTGDKHKNVFTQKRPISKSMHVRLMGDL